MNLIGTVVSIAVFVAAAAVCFVLRRQAVRQSRSADVIVALNGVLQGHIDELQLRSRDFERLGEMNELLQVSANIGEASDVLSAFGASLFHDFRGAVLITRSAPAMLEPVASWGGIADLEFGTGECWAWRRGHSHIGSAAGIRCPHAPGAGTTICVPMLTLGESLGVVTLTTDAPVLGADAERFIKTFADQIALAVANLRLQETLRSRAVRDALTGLYNRRHMEESLARELVRAARRNTRVGVMVVDVDHFKKFNDAYGHAGGDALLQQFAWLLLQVARAGDVVCRYGGEEFVVVMPDVDADMLRDRAEMLIEAARTLNVHIDGEKLGTITVSAGLAVSNDRATVAGLIGAADRALYAAKTAGRDRVAGPLPQIVGADAA